MSFFNDDFSVDDFLEVLDGLDNTSIQAFNKVPSYIEPQVEPNRNEKIKNIKNIGNKTKNAELLLIIDELRGQLHLKDEQITNMYYLLNSKK